MIADIDDKTCKRSKAIKRGSGAGTRGTVTVPALEGTTGAKKCTDVVWGFTTAYPDAISYTGTPATAPAYDFNIRCTGGRARPRERVPSAARPVPSATRCVRPAIELRAGVHQQDDELKQ